MCGRNTVALMIVSDSLISSELTGPAPWRAERFGGSGLGTQLGQFCAGGVEVGLGAFGAAALGVACLGEGAGPVLEEFAEFAALARCCSSSRAVSCLARAASVGAS
jgi:hypothetical protein